MQSSSLTRRIATTVKRVKQCSKRGQSKPARFRNEILRAGKYSVCFVDKCAVEQLDSALIVYESRPAKQRVIVNSICRGEVLIASVKSHIKRRSVRKYITVRV